MYKYYIPVELNDISKINGYARHPADINTVVWLMRVNGVGEPISLTVRELLMNRELIRETFGVIEIVPKVSVYCFATYSWFIPLMNLVKYRGTRKLTLKDKGSEEKCIKLIESVALHCSSFSVEKLSITLGMSPLWSRGESTAYCTIFLPSYIAYYLYMHAGASVVQIPILKTKEIRKGVKVDSSVGLFEIKDINAVNLLLTKASLMADSKLSMYMRSQQIRFGDILNMYEHSKMYLEY